MRVFVCCCLLAWLIWDYSGHVEVRHGPGMVAPHLPSQTAIKNPTLVELDGYQITPLADFEIEARVLGRERYYFDSSAALSPVDLALGWGPMSDERVLDELEISQSGRFYHWRATTLPIPMTMISRHSANMHLIPGNTTVEGLLKGRIRPGQVVQLKGYLVAIAGPNGWNWRSSLTRDDTGGGACEVILVNDMRVL